ncbi:flavodoxin family protein [Arhodomonas aquaeolei]|uniref:flavodoxin family protein n=1 Tax=Arhodomonas aquaeolei TaxID=2369 RepID=UPI0003786724|nr:NAD(P)H-dependent oxidoreductase [Arhodomonas aquaeolei]
MARRLLIVAHAPSPNTRTLLEAAERGARSPEVSGVEVEVSAPLETGPESVLACDAILLGTTENLGSMSGALKDFFDRCYYPVLERQQGLPCALYIRAGRDGTGTRRQAETIITGLRWRWVQPPLILQGTWDPAFADQVDELAEGLAAGLETGII